MIQMGGTVRDLAEAELCYAPQFGAAKDPVNLAGMLAENVLNGDMPLADWKRQMAVNVDGPRRSSPACSRRVSTSRSIRRMMISCSSSKMF